MARHQYLPLSDDQEFERFIRDLYRAKEGAEDYDLYRVSGTAQHGTDVYSLSRKTAIQCKCHDYNKKGPDAWQKEAAKVLREEFEKFLKHPHLTDYDRYIFCTTLPKSSHVEQAKEKIQRELIASGSTLTILYQPWEEIANDLEGQTQLIAQYGFRPVAQALLSPIPLITDLQGFVGREEELATIAERLAEDIPTALVRGMGGMGKTTLAKAYIRQYLSTYQKVIWLTLDQPYPQALLQDTSLLQKLNIPVTQEIKAEELMSRFREKLESMPGQHLLVLDNATSATLSKEYRARLPQQGWHILLTSREEIQGFTPYHIGHLHPEEALQLFRQHYTGKDSDAEVKALLEYIGYHTLTTELLAKTLQKSTLNGTAALLAKLKEQSLASEQINKKIRQHYSNEEESTLMQVLSQAFALQDLSKNEIIVLQWFACFPPQVIQLEEIAAVLPMTDKGIEAVYDVIQSLVSKGWIEQPERHTFRFHRLFAELIPIMEPIQWQTLELLVKGMTLVIRYEQYQDNPVDFFHWLPWSEHLIACTKEVKETAMIDLLDYHGRLLKDIGDYQGAKSAKLNALHLTQALYPHDNPTLNRLQSNLALVHQALGEYTEAKALLEYALAGNIAHYGEEHTEVQVVRCNLATVHQSLGEYIEAKPLLEQALVGDIANYGEEHPSVQISRSNLATLYIALREYTEARALFEVVLKGMINHYGEEHPNVQATRSNLAVVYQELGNFIEAKEMIELALAGAIGHYGEKHPVVQTKRSNLATVYKDLGEYAEAKGLLEQVLKVIINHHGEKHPTVATTWNNLAFVHDDLGEVEEAKAAWLKAYAIFLVNFGPEHPDSQIVIRELTKRGWLP